MIHEILSLKSEATKGRKFKEPASKWRTDFQRDRDRILHSSAFRRLMHKTQVFISHEGDLYRNRLTHSLEVSQIARTIAKNLNLNEDLTEALCLSHDLGHTPFGHAGQFSLNKSMKKVNPSSNGFEHNIQSLRVVDLLEKKYADFDGLNLCFETREGILKRCSKSVAKKFGDIAQRFVFGGQPSLEAQVTNIADEIAYNHHDLDDGLRAGLISWEEIILVPQISQQLQLIERSFPKLNDSRKQAEVIRRMINSQVEDLILSTLKRIKIAKINSQAEVRAHSLPLVGFSREMSVNVKSLKLFLHERLYKHPNVSEMNSVAKVVIEDLFYEMVMKSNSNNDLKELRSIADIIAAMTDRDAAILHNKWFPKKVCWPKPVGFV